MKINGYELITEWKNSTCGQTAQATKGGKKYFLKKYQTPVAPLNNGALDKKTIAHNQKLFDRFVAIRREVNKRIRPLAGEGGNLLIPCDDFIYENHYVDVSEFAEGIISGDELVSTLASLSFDQKLLLMKTAAGALVGVHGKEVVHCDLKLDNFVLVRNAAGNYVAKLLDFDSAFPIGMLPEELVGTIDYYSPELGVYSESEDDAEEKALLVKEKTDIFSLGLIYHIYLTGSFPEAVNLTEKLRKRREKGKVIYSWVALNSGCELQLSPEIRSVKFVSLISDMLSIDPKDRPTALEVLRRLQTLDGESEGVVLQELWPEHNLLLDRAALSAAGVLKLEKVIQEDKNQYRLLYATGKKLFMTREDLLSAKYAKPAPKEGFCTPWPEHSIQFDLDKLKLRGFVAAERKEQAGTKGYVLFRSDASETFFKADMLVGMRYATKKVTVVVPEGENTPWPEHNVVFDMDAVKAKGYVGFKRNTLAGVKGYTFFRSNGTEQFIRVELAVIQKLARKL